MQTSEQFVHPYNDETGRWERVAEVYLGGYSWAIAVVWRDTTTGRLYGDTDGGCSCYGPFEVGGWGDFECHSLGELTEITSREQASALLDDLCGEDGEASTTERLDFARAVEVALSGKQAPA